MWLYMSFDNFILFFIKIISESWSLGVMNCKLPCFEDSSSTGGTSSQSLKEPFFEGPKLISYIWFKEKFIALNRHLVKVVYYNHIILWYFHFFQVQIGQKHLRNSNWLDSFDWGTMLLLYYNYIVFT